MGYLYLPDALNMVSNMFRISRIGWNSVAFSTSSDN